MRRWTVFAALLLAACGDDPQPVSKDMSIGMNTLRYVTDTVTLPTGELEYTYDPLGEGVKRNRLGAIVGSLNFSGVKVQESEDHAIARGDALNLLAITSADPQFIADPGAQAEFWAAEKMAPPEDGGVGTWTIDRAVAQATFRGPLAGSRFQSDDPRPLKDPPTFFFKISLSGGDAVLIPIVGARITFVAATDRLTEGQLNGGMRKTDIDTLLIPAIARLLTEGLHKMPCDDKCMKNNEDIAKRFDTGGCGTATAMDTNIDICEVSENGLVKNLLAAEVQLFDAAGKWAPNAANTKPDSLTMGVAFTATRADFVP